MAHQGSTGLYRVACKAWPLLAVLMALDPVLVHADLSASVLFEKPASVQKVPRKSDADPVGEIHCTYYADFMIRETGTDSPAADNAMLIRGPRPACSAANVPGAVTLKTAAYILVGRVGPFLMFEATDPNGASGFLVVDADNGRTIYSDGLVSGGIHAVAVENGSLHIRFTRAVNGSCSVLKDGARCWAKFVADGKIPRAMAQMPPPVQACAASYQQSKDPPDNPNEIFYDVDMVLDRMGKAQVLSRGAIGCVGVP